MAKQGLKGDLKVKRWITHVLMIEREMIESLWKAVWQFSETLNIKFLFNPTVALSGIYPRKNESVFT